MSCDVFADMTQKIDRNNRSPLYLQVCDYLREKIYSHQLNSGDAILSHRELSRISGISETTIRRAIHELVEQKSLISRTSSSTYVADFNDKTSVPPSPRTPSLTKNTSKSIGLVTTNATTGYPFLTQVIAGVRQANKSQTPLQFFEQHQNNFSHLELSKKIPLQQTAGIIMFSPFNLDLVTRCQREKKPYVLLHNDLADHFSHCVLVNYASGILEAITHLVKNRQCTKIAMVTAAANRSSTARMILGYQIASKHFDLHYNNDLIIHAGYGETQGYQSTLTLLKMGTKRPDAIIYSADDQAKGGLKAVLEKNISVPNELAIIGIGNALPPCEFSQKLTTVDTYNQKLGYLAMDLLQKLIDGKKDTPTREIIMPKLILRETA